MVTAKKPVKKVVKKVAPKGGPDAFGFNAKGSKPVKKLAGPVGVNPRGVKVDKAKGRPDRPLSGPTGMVFPIPTKKSPRRGKAK